MQIIIDRDSKSSPATQISEFIVKQIRSGGLRPGKRMPGVRVFAEIFKTSPNTVVSAFDLLEKQNYIERIPAKGTFVADDVCHDLKISRLVFPFPESSLSPATMGNLENWGCVSEFYRGLIADAAKLNAEIVFLHFVEAKNNVQLTRQLRKLDDFDGAIFIGSKLSDLRNGFTQKNRPCVMLSPSTQLEPLPNIANICGDPAEAFEQLVVHLAERKYRNIRILTSREDNRLDQQNIDRKIAYIMRAAGRKGIISDKSMVHEINDVEDVSVDRTFAKFHGHLKEHQEAIFATDRIVPAVYRYANRNKFKIGEDFGIFSYASGFTFNNLIPELTFSKINHFEMGKNACQIAVNAINGKDWRGVTCQVNNTLIINHST